MERFEKDPRPYPDIGRALRSDDRMILIQAGARVRAMGMRGFFKQLSRLERVNGGISFRTGFTGYGDVVLELNDDVYLMSPAHALSVADHFGRMHTKLERQAAAGELGELPQFVAGVRDELRLRVKQTRSGYHKQLAATASQTAGRA